MKRDDVIIMGMKEGCRNRKETVKEEERPPK